MKISKISNVFCALALTLSLASFTTDKNVSADEKDAAKAVKFDAALYKIVDTNKVRLSVNKPSDGRLRVIVKDKSGKVYYAETFSEDNTKYRRVFDLDEMGDGTYYFEMHNNKEKLVKEIEIKSTSEKLVSLR